MSTKCGFVRALWGDEAVVRRSKVVEDIEDHCKRPLQARPEVVFSYGDENHELLRGFGMNPIKVTDDPVVDWDGTGDRDSHDRGGYNYGYILWRHKTDAILRAFEHFDEVIWLDWDVRVLKEPTEAMWARLRLGAPIQMPLCQYHRRICRWRGKYHSRKLPLGAWLYCRAPWIVERVNELYRDDKTAVDQTLFAMVMDQMSGMYEKGAFTVEGYVMHGFQPYCVRIFDQVVKPEEPLFKIKRSITDKRAGHRRRMWKKGAWKR